MFLENDSSLIWPDKKNREKKNVTKKGSKNAQNGPKRKNNSTCKTVRKNVGLSFFRPMVTLIIAQKLPVYRTVGKKC